MNQIFKQIRQEKTEISPNKKSKMRRVHKVGVLVAFRDSSNVVRIGWSAVNKTAGDRYNKTVGISLAKERATKPSTLYGQLLGGNLPSCVEDALPKFLDRCKRYFGEFALT